MTVIHKKCGTKLVPSGKGDYGICPKCKCRVDHLLHTGYGKVGFNKETEIIFD